MNIKIITIFILTSFSLIAHSQTQCETPIEDLQSDAKKFIGDMKIAKVRGDIKAMTDAFVTFSPIAESCKEKLKNFCTFDCHIQLAEFHLFMASEISYYYSKASSDSDVQLLKPEDLESHVNDGLAVVKRAQSIVATNGKGDFRDFLKRNAQFHLIKAKLLVASGDNWYQTISSARIERLKYINGSATEKPGQSSESESSNQNIAKAQYEEAMWTLQEAIIDVPEETMFDGIRSEVLSLVHDVERRLNSLNKGFLFLNIDPEQFTSLSISKLRDELTTLGSKIQAVETKIEGVIQNWIEAKGNQDVNKINEMRRSKDMSINSSSYKIAKMEGAAKEFTEQISQQLQELNSQEQGYEYEIRRKKAIFGLKSKLAELTHRQDIIEKRKDIDILSFKGDKLGREISNLQWLINWNVAKANLELQLSTFESQISEHESRKSIYGNKIDQVELQKSAYENRKKISNARIAEYNSSIKLNETERDKIYKENLKSLEAKICTHVINMKYLSRTELTEYEFVESECDIDIADKLSSKQYLEKTCELRKNLAEENVTTVKDALCRVGIDNIPNHIIEDNELSCGNVTEFSRAKEIFEMEMDLAEKEISNNAAKRDRIKKQLETLRDNFRDMKTLKASLKATEAVAAAAYMTSATFPKTTTCACGLAAGVSVTTDLSKAASVAFSIAKGALEHGIDWKEFEIKYHNQIDQLNSDLNTAIANLSAENFAKQIKNKRAIKALAEITGRSLNLSQELVEAALKEESVTVDCDKNGADLNQQIEVIQSEYEGLIAETKKLKLRKSNIDLAIESENRNIRIEQTNIKNYDLSLAELDIEINSIQKNIATTDKLIKDINARKALVTGLKSNVTNLATEVERKTVALKNVSKLKEAKSLAISDLEYDQVSTVIRSEKTYTSRLLDTIDQLEENQSIEDSFKKELRAYQSKVNGQISKERTTILNYIDESSSTTGATQKVFLATQQELSRMVRGVPHFISTKRQMLERANLYLTLLRNKVDALISLKGSTNPLSLANTKNVTYIKTHADLEKAKSLIQDEYWSPEAPSHESKINVQVTKIDIPSDSGLARTLASKRQAIFEISPSGRLPSANFSLWSTDFDPDNFGLVQNLLLVDMNLRVDFEQSTCTSRLYVLEHLGFGYTFREMSSDDDRLVPNLVVTQRRVKTPNYYIDMSPQSKAQKVMDFWTQDHYVQSFLQQGGPPNSPSGTLPMMGLPLVGNYRLTLSKPSEGCSFENASFTIIAAYATDPRI